MPNLELRGGSGRVETCAACSNIMFHLVCYNYKQKLVHLGRRWLETEITLFWSFHTPPTSNAFILGFENAISVPGVNFFEISRPLLVGHAQDLSIGMSNVFGVQKLRPGPPIP